MQQVSVEPGSSEIAGEYSTSKHAEDGSVLAVKEVLVATGLNPAVFKHLPLPLHKQAERAAVAALAAGRQGKFWEMHDALFARQGARGCAKSP